MMLEMIQNTNMTLMNAQPVCQGKWTRVNTKKPEERSVLDYVLASPSLSTSITSMVIDEDESHKLVSQKTKTDHNTIIFEMNINLEKINEPEARGKWKINPSTDWTQFDNTAARSQVITLPPRLSETTTHYYQIWLQNVHEIAKVTIGMYPNKKKQNQPYRDDPGIQLALAKRKEAKAKYLETLKNGVKDPEAINEYAEAKSELRDEFKRKEATTANNKLRRMMDEGVVNSRSFWNVRRKIKKGNLQDLCAVKNSQGERMFNPEMIKEFTADYFENLYTPSEHEDFNPEWTKCIEELNNIRLQIDDYQDMPYNRPLEPNETAEAAKQLHHNRGVGPDLIPNEFILNSETIQKSTHQLFARIFETEDIPEQFGEGYMINFHKGKGDKEILDHKRGITLTSNVGKLFERVLNNRVKKVLPFSEAQAGGRDERGPPDQLFILYEILKQRRVENKPTYVAFIDVHKAYDKAWRGMILHVLWEANIRGKLWRILNHLNSNITAKILTRFGLTRVIQVKGGVKQGGVLSVGQFSKMIDELNKELDENDLGVTYADLRVACLMFVDDVILIADTAEELQKALDVTYGFFCKNHLKISQAKSNVIVFNKKARTPMQTWTCVPLVLEEVHHQYKYLGHIVSSNLNNKNNIDNKKRLIEAALTVCMAVASDEILHHIKLDTLTQLYNTCIVPIILYGSEVWTESNYAPLEQMQHKCLKRILKVPTSTPNAAKTMEFGNLPIQTLAHRRQVEKAPRQPCGTDSRSPGNIDEAPPAHMGPPYRPSSRKI